MKIGKNQLAFDEIGDWSRSFRITIYSIFIFLLTVLFFLLDISSQWSELKKMQQKEVQLKTDLTAQYQTAANLVAYQSQLQDINKIFQGALAQLPVDNKVADLLDDISKASKAAGLKLITLEPQQEIIQGYYAVLPIQVNVAGNYNQMGYFVSKLAGLNRIIMLGNYTIKSKAQNIGTNNFAGEHLTMAMRINSYRYIGNASATPTTQLGQA